MKIKQILSSGSIYESKNLRALIMVAALVQLSFGQSLPLSRIATSADFSISISPSSVIIPPGGTADYTITVTGASTSSDVTFSVTGIPSHSTASITMESGSVYSLAITTSRLTPQGEYVFTVTATSGSMSASATAKVIVLLSSS